MSLVAYDSSEESEEEIASNEMLPIIPKCADASVKRSRESVKITIPSLKEFEEVESEKVPEKKPKLQSGSGLFSLLPPPKNATILSKPGFVPHILKSKKEALTSSSIKLSNISIKKSESHFISSSSVPVEHDSDDDISYETGRSSGEGLNFFSFDDSKDTTSLDKYASYNYLSTDIASTSLENDKLLIHQSYESSPSLASSEIYARFVQKQSSALSSSNYLQQPLIQNGLEDTPYSQLYQNTDVPVVGVNYQQGSSEYYPVPTTEPDTKETLLKDEGFLKLQGRRRDLEAIDIIEVNASDQLTNKNEWLMKSLTEETSHRPSRKKHNMPTQQQKRKHQITYLAFQAKEREMDLKNQWGLNNRTRRETQAKYGF